MENLNQFEQANRILNNPAMMVSGEHIAPFVLLIVSVLVVLMIWSLVWKALAMWKAARKGDKIWFVVFLIINTLGILDILYIYVFSKDSKKSISNTNTNTQSPTPSANETKN